jgi:hypothetical protein
MNNLEVYFYYFIFIRCPCLEKMCWSPWVMMVWRKLMLAVPFLYSLKGEQNCNQFCCYMFTGNVGKYWLQTLILCAHE